MEKRRERELQSPPGNNLTRFKIGTTESPEIRTMPRGAGANGEAIATIVSSTVNWRMGETLFVCADRNSQRERGMAWAAALPRYERAR